MNFILFIAFAYNAISFITNHIDTHKYMNKIHQSFTVEDIIDSNVSDWKSLLIIKYNNTKSNKIVPMRIMKCNIIYPYQDDNEKEAAKIRTLYNKLQQIHFLENNNIDIVDKLQIVEHHSIIKRCNKTNKSLDENDAKLFEKLQLKQNIENAELRWFYDW
jgi:hypothetical protein